jgi:hypothetical protein
LLVVQAVAERMLLVLAERVIPLQLLHPKETTEA